MIRKTTTIFAFLCFWLPNHAVADVGCLNRYTSINVCDEARRLSEGIAQELPLSLNKNMMIHSTLSYRNTTQLNILLAYNREHLDSVIKDSKKTASEVKEKIHSFARNMCSENMIKSFIRTGVILKLVYTFSDGEKYTEIIIDRC